jgi:hypothetical protein
MFKADNSNLRRSVGAFRLGLDFPGATRFGLAYLEILLFQNNFSVNTRLCKYKTPRVWSDPTINYLTNEANRSQPPKSVLAFPLPDIRFSAGVVISEFDI